MASLLRVCVAVLLRVCVAVLLELTELANPVEMPCRRVVVKNARGGKMATAALRTPKPLGNKAREKWLWRSRLA